MRYTWLFILPLIAFIAIVAYSLYRFYAKKRSNKKAVMLAHSKKIRSLPEYEKARVRYRVLMTLTAIAFVVSMLSVTISASRPISVEVVKPDYDTRDIMLCIDVSASTSSTREDLLNYLSDVITGLEGQRLGITIFATKSASLSPLTNDYESLRNTIDTLRGSFFTSTSGNRFSYYQYVVGVTSAIGSGVLSCIENFDELQKEGHSQSIIIATDNMQTDGDYTMEQAANYASRFGITLYGIDTVERSTGSNEDSYTQAYRKAITRTGGVYYSISKSALSATDVVDEILKQEAIKHESKQQYVQADSPKVYTIIAAVSVLLFLLLVWRMDL